MLRYILSLSHKAILWRNIIDSKSYRSGRKGAVIATDSNRSGNILAVSASKSYCSDS